MTLNDKDGKQYGDITYKPDDVILFSPNTWHGWVNGDTPFEFFGFDMQEKSNASLSARAKDRPVTSGRPMAKMP